jgi:uncharacterized membrane protein YgdD (TMEM256/DUF423 family)
MPLAPGTRLVATAAALLAAVAAALAAAGSHALSAQLSPADLRSFNTAVAFQFVNALGLFAVAWARERLAGSLLAATSGWLLLAGILLFCGSIYAARLGMTGSPGPAAPLGGSLVIVAWLVLAAAFLSWRSR